MMDWTDRHCRYFHRQLSQRARLYTEMITTGALLHGDVPRHLDFDPAEQPVALQLGGSDLRIQGGGVFQGISRCFGWKFGKRCQQGWRKLKRSIARDVNAPESSSGTPRDKREAMLDGLRPTERR